MGSMWNTDLGGRPRQRQGQGEVETWSLQGRNKKAQRGRKEGEDSEMTRDLIPFDFF